VSGYAATDGFGGVTTGVKITDPATGIAWALGFDDSTSPPGVVWVAASTWAVAKARLGGTWAQAKASAQTWGGAKAVVAA
jgi:hypothetical protein